MKYLLTLIAVGFVLTTSGVARAGLLIDLDGQSGPTQADYTSWDPTGTGTLGTLNESKSFVTTLGTGGSVDVTMTTASDTYERNYGVVTGSLSDQNDLLKDIVFFNQGNSGSNFYQMQFDNLKAGVYRFIGYHVATNLLNGDATVDIMLNGADTGLDVTLLNTNSPAEVRSSVVNFIVANANDPITIGYVNPTENHFGLNGFELIEPPDFVGVNIDDFSNASTKSLREGRPSRFSLPVDYVNYELDGGALDVITTLATDGTMGVEVDSPYFRNTLDTNYNDVTVLDPTTDPVKGFNTVMNSGALVNDLSNQTIELALSDLVNGDYEVTFWLHSIFTHGAGASTGLWDISGSAVADNVLATLGYDTPSGANPVTGFGDIGSITLPFTVTDGTALFTFTPDTLAGNGQLWLNGFEVQAATMAEAVPEPSTFVLGCLGVIGLMWFGRRRTRRSVEFSS